MRQFTFSDKLTGWKRLRQELLRVLVVLLLLELACRIDPVRGWLSAALDPYENLLWYSDVMPTYREQLRSDLHYDVWLVGSSYMMTGLNPAWIQEKIAETGSHDLTVQNYGLLDLRNLSNMADVISRWMFPLDKPDYLVIGISIFNFSPSAQLPAPITVSPMESVMIFPDSIDDYVAGFLYNTSSLYRYTLLARNATIVPREEALLDAKPLGGFIDSATVIGDCDPSLWQADDAPQTEFYQQDSAFEPLYRFIQMVEAQHIPVAVVDIPLQFCNMRRFFNSYASYKANYIDPVIAHLAESNIPFLEIADLFYDDVPDDDQFNYFMDYHHPNREGARLFSDWTGEFLAAWLDDSKPAS